MESNIVIFYMFQDVAEAFASIMESNIQGPVNITSGQLNLDMKELIYKIAKKLGKLDLVKLGALPFSEKEPLFLGANTELLKKKN